MALLDTDSFDDRSILPPPPDGVEAVLHDREYRVRAFRMSAERIVLQGAVRDQKPPGLYLHDDANPLTVHHMQLAVEVAFPSLQIEAVTTVFDSHPHDECPQITGRYDALVGLSIARGFTKQVAALFGGPRGCTHVTALLYAMAPVATQCFWSMRASSAVLEGRPNPMFDPDSDEPDDMWRAIVNTCHIWDEHGAQVAAREASEPHEIPVFLRERLAELGRTPAP